MAEITVCDQTVTIPDAPSPSPSPSGDGGVFVVTFTVDEDAATATADKTFAETLAAKENGQWIVMVADLGGGNTATLETAYDSEAGFMGRSLEINTATTNVSIIVFGIAFGESGTEMFVQEVQVPKA